MRCAISFAAFTLAALTAAAPNIFEKRDSCNHDNCYRAVFGTNAKQGTAQASADCSSLFKTTVVPCAVTSTFTTTATISSIIATSRVVTFDTTTTLTITSTVTGTAAAVVVNKPKRDAVTTCPSYSSAVNPPAYASACSGYARYSSACNCQGGISRSTVTASPATVSTTVTSTMTVMTLMATVDGGTTTSTIYTTTTVPPAPVCSSFYLQASSGSFVGDYLTNGNGSPSNTAYLQPDSTQAVVFTTNSQGYLNMGSYTLYNPGVALRFYPFDGSGTTNIVVCTFASGGPPYAGNVACYNNDEPAQNVFIDNETGSGTDDGLLLTDQTKTSQSGAQAITLSAVPAC